MPTYGYMATTNINMAATHHITALAELLKPTNVEVPEDENLLQPYSSQTNVLTPGHIGTVKTKNEASSSISAKAPLEDIWSKEEVQDCQQLNDAFDSRVAPEYEILFKQQVTSEDMFLGMSGRNPSTACCEDLTVKIYLPDTEFSSVQLNVTDSFLDCQTSKYKLGLYFPHSVESKKGKAQWESEKSLLTVTAPMIREYDFLTNSF